ncbi:MAG TPA: cytochrome c [Rhizomicrobium sp.]|nr:cytochrome c [Rhizomicrobium sp.]
MMKSVRCLLLLVPCLAASSAYAQPPAVFTADQARRGQVIYPRQCGACHGPDMEGGSGPALTGPDFRQLLTDQNRTARSLLDVIRETMPYDAPGIDPDADYDDITAFILSRLGYPAGDEKLTPDNPRLPELKLGGA